jgi:hypothetical protein
MIADRLDPALRQFATARTDLSASVLGVVRDSLNQRRAEAGAARTADIDSACVTLWRDFGISAMTLRTVPHAASSRPMAAW